MRVAGLILSFIIGSFFTERPGFKYLDAATPLYIGIKGLPADSDDSMSALLKDTLRKIGFGLIGSAQKAALVKQFFEDAKFNASQLTGKEWANPKLSLANIFSNGTKSQSLTIIYSYIKDAEQSLLSCDSIGFAYFKLPPRSIDQKPVRQVWHIREVGSRSADSIALFILKKL
jgi:hypothetical protein